MFHNKGNPKLYRVFKKPLIKKVLNRTLVWYAAEFGR